jgi:sulfite dehydrogenase (cytochrome) subunit B
MNVAYPLAIVVIVAVLQIGTASAGEEVINLRDGTGRELTASRCAICHSLDYLEMNAAVMDQAGWKKSVRKMVDGFGAPITEEETRQILEYLDANYTVPVADAR